MAETEVAEMGAEAEAEAAEAVRDGLEGVPLTVEEL